ncbi:MAG: protein-export chaperone SecB [Clostridiales bacterium]|nr:protein-export chaperone SecB [Clostridiales bacterium]
MNIVTFRGYKVSECSFVNKYENGQKVEFENSYSYSVRYNSGNGCIGQITVDSHDKAQPEKFGIKIVLEGIFSFDTSQPKEKIHVQSFKELFPFARAFVSTVSTAAGIPPIIIPPFDIEGQSIYKVEKNI